MSAGKGMAALERINQGENGESGRQKSGERLPQVAICLETGDMTEDGCEEGGGGLYGQFLGVPYYRRGEGIRFVFVGAYVKAGQWLFDDWEVVITPRKDASNKDLYMLWRQLCENKISAIRKGKDVGDISVEPAKIIGREPPEEKQ